MTHDSVSWESEYWGIEPKIHVLHQLYYYHHWLATFGLRIDFSGRREEGAEVFTGCFKRLGMERLTNLRTYFTRSWYECGYICGKQHPNLFGFLGSEQIICFLFSKVDEWLIFGLIFPFEQSGKLQFRTLTLAREVVRVSQRQVMLFLFFLLSQCTMRMHSVGAQKLWYRLTISSAVGIFYYLVSWNVDNL